MWNFFATFAGPIATIVASFAALFVTWRFGTIQAGVAREQAKIAQGQMRIADEQKYIARARFKLDFYEKRYSVFEAARSLLIQAVQHDHVDAEQVITFRMKTADAVFLFDDDVPTYLAGLLNKTLRFRALKAQEKAADEYNEEEKRQRLVDLGSEQHQLLNDELAVITDKFLPYLKFGNL